MTDIELLELTAKAAGYGYQWSEDARMFVSGIPGIGWKEWNPLSSDGDAFRLAVRLGIDIVFEAGEEGAQVVCAQSWDAVEKSPRTEYVELLCKDGNWATRRAIVAAAAEIGRNLP